VLGQPVKLAILIPLAQIPILGHLIRSPIIHLAGKHLFGAN